MGRLILNHIQAEPSVATDESGVWTTQIELEDTDLWSATSTRRTMDPSNASTGWADSSLEMVMAKMNSTFTDAEKGTRSSMSTDDVP